MRGGRTVTLVVILALAASGAFGRTWYVKPDGTGDTTTIKAACDSATAVGDTVLVDCGTYREVGINLRGVTLMSVSGSPDCVIIDGSGIGGSLIRAWTAPFRLEGLTLQNGSSFNCYRWLGGGGALHMIRSGVIERCRFEGNSGCRGGAIKIDDSGTGLTDLTIRDCEFRQNGAKRDNAMIATGKPDDARSVTIENTLFEFNAATHGYGGGGIELYAYTTITNSTFVENTGRFRCTFMRGCEFRGHGASTQLTVWELDECIIADNNTTTQTHLVSASRVSNCTFVANSAGPVGSMLASGSIANSIFAFNSAGAIVRCANTAAPVTCCDFFQNTGTTTTGCDANGNFFEDPLFCLTTLNDYTLQPDSPCATANSGCGRVGARSVGCGPVSLESQSWGRIKSLYR